MPFRVAERTFSMDDQQRFAELSGDRNPIHLDPLAARRTQAGAVVVHGVHAVLWALEQLARENCLRQPVAQLEVRFDHFIYLETGVTLDVVRHDDARLRARLFAGAANAATLDITYGSPEPQLPPIASASDPQLDSPWTGGLEQFGQRSGTIAPARTSASSVFPVAAACIGETHLDAVARLSYLVGMVCPGLHSVFSGFSLGFTRTAGDGAASPLRYRVTKIDERFRLIEIAVEGSDAIGTVTAFVRHPPIAQHSLDVVRRSVGAAEFAQTTALVAGGSRGLGALTARIIAAGGGRVVLTYATGEADALGVAREIGSERCAVLRLDVRDDPAARLEELPWPVDQLYYFASPPINRHTGRTFTQRRFEEFCDFYVSGFERLWTALRSRTSGSLRAFYPSSSAVEERPRDMTEYAMAKAAGELLCDDLNRFTPGAGAHILSCRLPRILTDQTVTMMPVETSDGLDVMLPIVRELHSAS